MPGSNPTRTPPFAAFEWAIALRYLRASRREGGIGTMTWISVIGIALAVFALIAVLAVRSGFRTEFVDTILGANAHVTVYSEVYGDEFGRATRVIADFDTVVERVRTTPDVVRVAPMVKGQVMASANSRNVGVQVYGQRREDVLDIPRIAEPEEAAGSLDDYDTGVAIGSGIARELNLRLGDQITLISPDGVQTAFGRTPRISHYEVVYIFQVGRYDIDQTRIYMPLAEAQRFFNRLDVVDELEVMVRDPDAIDEAAAAIQRAADRPHLVWTWRDASGGYLRALEMEDRVMSVLMSVLVLIATMNITSGLIMLVKNKGRDVGILRTMGLNEGSVLRVFFLCGALIGLLGTMIGVIVGCLFAIYIDPIFGFVDWIMGGGVWDPSVRYLSRLPARLELGDVLFAVGLALILSFVVTIFPARRAARLNPVEALRYE